MPGISIKTQKHGINNFLVLMEHTLIHFSAISNRAIYFAAYSTAKEKLNGVLEPDTTQVHMVSAGIAGTYLCEATG